MGHRTLTLRRSLAALLCGAFLVGTAPPCHAIFGISIKKTGSATYKISAAGLSVTISFGSRSRSTASNSANVNTANTAASAKTAVASVSSTSASATLASQAQGPGSTASVSTSTAATTATTSVSSSASTTSTSGGSSSSTSVGAVVSRQVAVPPAVEAFKSPEPFSDAVDADQYLEQLFHNPSAQSLKLEVPRYGYFTGLAYVKGKVNVIGQVRVIGGIIAAGAGSPVQVSQGAMVTTNPDAFANRVTPPTNRYRIVEWHLVGD